MKTYRIILLIAGMLVAGLAINTSFAHGAEKENKQERNIMVIERTIQPK